MMKYIRIFEDFGTHYSPAQLAVQIEAAVGGVGTDEQKFANLVRSLRSKQELDELNRIMSSDLDKFTYPTLGDAIENELGFMDQEYRTQIESHLKQINMSDYVSQTVSKKYTRQPQANSLISSIMPRVIQHEGKKSQMYIDSRGIPTVGVGFNLKNEDSSSRLKKVGANPAKIKAGKAKLSDSQIQTLLVEDLERAMADAHSLVANFDKLPATIQGVLVEMAFNLGRNRLSEFKKFLSNISLGKWSDAAKEMLRSDWKNQVGQRAQTLANLIKSAV